MNRQQSTARPPLATDEFVAAFNGGFVDTGLVEPIGEYRDGKPLYRPTALGRQHLAQQQRRTGEGRWRRLLRRR